MSRQWQDKARQDNGGDGGVVVVYIEIIERETETEIDRERHVRGLVVV